MYAFGCEQAVTSASWVGRSRKVKPLHRSVQTILTDYGKSIRNMTSGPNIAEKEARSKRTVATWWAKQRAAARRIALGISDDVEPADEGSSAASKIRITARSMQSCQEVFGEIDRMLYPTARGLLSAQALREILPTLSEQVCKVCDSYFVRAGWSSALLTLLNGTIFIVARWYNDTLGWF